MTAVKSFKDLGVTSSSQRFAGEKIKVQRILNKEIVVHDYRIEPSKFKEKGNGKCLYLQIALGETKHVVFTGSSVLQETIQKVDRKDFPFKTTIVLDNERLEFQ
jgi:hypothetical protein